MTLRLGQESERKEKRKQSEAAEVSVSQGLNNVPWISYCGGNRRLRSELWRDEAGGRLQSVKEKVGGEATVPVNTDRKGGKRDGGNCKEMYVWCG